MTSSARRAATTATLTATSPILDLNLGARTGRRPVRATLRAAPVRTLAGSGLWRAVQCAPHAAGLRLSAARAPTPGGDAFRFPTVLLSRTGNFSSEELIGERRKGSLPIWSFASGQSDPDCAGTRSGGPSDPFCLFLGAKGAVRVTVLNAVTIACGVRTSRTRAEQSSPVSRAPMVRWSSPRFLQATSESPLDWAAAGTTGSSSGTLLYDDQIVELTVRLAPSVSFAWCRLPTSSGRSVPR